MRLPGQDRILRGTFNYCYPKTAEMTLGWTFLTGFLQKDSSTRLDLRSATQQLFFLAYFHLARILVICRLFVIISKVFQTLLYSFSLLTAFSHNPFFLSCILCVCNGFQGAQLCSRSSPCPRQSKQSSLQRPTFIKEQNR